MGLALAWPQPAGCPPCTHSEATEARSPSWLSHRCKDVPSPRPHLPMADTRQPSTCASLRSLSKEVCTGQSSHPGSSTYPNTPPRLQRIFLEWESDHTPLLLITLSTDSQLTSGLLGLPSLALGPRPAGPLLPVPWTVVPRPKPPASLLLHTLLLWDPTALGLGAEPCLSWLSLG